jgi:hypothetical protein
MHALPRVLGCTNRPHGAAAPLLARCSLQLSGPAPCLLQIPRRRRTTTGRSAADRSPRHHERTHLFLASKKNALPGKDVPSFFFEIQRTPPLAAVEPASNFPPLGERYSLLEYNAALSTSHADARANTALSSCNTTSRFRSAISQAAHERACMIPRLGCRPLPHRRPVSSLAMSRRCGSSGAACKLWMGCSSAEISSNTRLRQ